MKSLHKVLNIIEVISEKKNAGIQEISIHTGYPPPTVHRIVNTLLRRNYLEQDRQTKAYRLSLLFFKLGIGVQQQFDLISAARPYLRSLVEDTNENANLAVEDGDHVIYVDHVRGTHLLQMFTQLGGRAPLYCTGVGKLLLAERAPEALKCYLESVERVACTPQTLVSPQALSDELETIRRQGYALDNEEREAGVRCVAALVRDYQGCAVGAISISGATMRISDERIAVLSKKVMAACHEVSRALGYAN